MLKSADEVKICNTHFYFISTLLLDHVLLKIKFFAIEGPKMVLKKS